MKRLLLKYLVACAAAFVLCGCSLYTRYARNADELPLDGLFGETATADSTTLADISWRAFFTDVQLQRLIERGLENNADLRTASLRTEQAEAALKAARLGYYPTLNIAPTASWSLHGFDTQSGSWQLPAQISWEIDAAGRIRNRKLAAAAAREQAIADCQYVRTRLIASIANSYYTLLMLDSQLEISRTTSDNWRENVRIMRAMKEAGMTNEASVSQTEANSCAIEASLYDLRRQIRDVETALSLLLGEAPHTIERGTLEGQTLREDLLTGVPAQLLENRPDVRSAELVLEQAFCNVNLARAAFYPSLSLGGTLGWMNNGTAIGSPAQFLLSLAGSLLQPVFTGGANRARLKIAIAQQEEARIAFVQTLLAAGGEVNDALEQCLTARGKSDVRRRQIAALESAVNATQQLMRYSDKSYTYLEVLTSQQNLLQAQLSQVADRFEGIQGMINLYQALGGGRE